VLTGASAPLDPLADALAAPDAGGGALGGATFGFEGAAAGVAPRFAADFAGRALATERVGAFSAAFAEGFAVEVEREGGRVAGVLRCIDGFAGAP